MNKGLFGILLMAACAFPFACGAVGIDKNTAKMQAMDKITGRVSVIYVPVGGAVDFGTFSIAVRSCKTRPAEETPDNFAFADIADKTLQGEKINIFRGWMISSSPATHAVEHPIYDVWLLQCVDKKVDTTLLLTDEQFAEREEYPMVRNEDSAAKTLKSDDSEHSARQMEEMNEEEHEQQLLPSIEFSYDEAEMEEEEEDEEAPKQPEQLTDEPQTDVESAPKDEIISILPPENPVQPENTPENENTVKIENSAKGDQPEESAKQ